ncbi:hypothetical protein ACSFA0_22820 [Variovorax sp. LT1P1]|uniref:hypothetical protein n=1 Tax=Variovorax sp. LT1P1 TaxID=3443730 RepID=UPI003F48241D
MFSTAKLELRELLDLTRQITSFDVTLAAKPEIVPEESANRRRRQWEHRQIELMAKYELL